MQASSKHFFSQQELDSIAEAVKEAESKTSGEIVPVLASASDDYDRACFLAAILFSLMGTALFSAIWILLPGMFGGSVMITAIVLIVVQFLGLLAGFYAAISIDGVRKAFIPHRILNRQVSRAAHQAFLHFQITHTENATGILIYVSLFERMVAVVADRSINRKHNQETWDEVRDLLIAGLKEQNGAEGFTRAIGRCGEILAADFPIQPDDTNELANELRLI